MANHAATLTVAEIARITGGVVARDGPPVTGVWPDAVDLPPGHVLERALACPTGRMVVGITGSAGKSTTRQMIAAALSLEQPGAVISSGGDVVTLAKQVLSPCCGRDGEVTSSSHSMTSRRRAALARSATSLVVELGVPPEDPALVEGDAPLRREVLRDARA